MCLRTCASVRLFNCATVCVCVGDMCLCLFVCEPAHPRFCTWCCTCVCMSRGCLSTTKGIRLAYDKDVAHSRQIISIIRISFASNKRYSEKTDLLGDVATKATPNARTHPPARMARVRAVGARWHSQAGGHAHSKHGRMHARMHSNPLHAKLASMNAFAHSRMNARAHTCAHARLHKRMAAHTAPGFHGGAVQERCWRCARHYRYHRSSNTTKHPRVLARMLARTHMHTCRHGHKHARTYTRTYTRSYACMHGAGNRLKSKFGVDEQVHACLCACARTCVRARACACMHEHVSSFSPWHSRCSCRRAWHM